MDRALGALDGEPDPNCDLGEEVQMVIEQRMESRGVIDLGKVRMLREWAVGELLGLRVAPMEGPIPDWVPSWARECLFRESVAVCDWVLSLKGGEG